MLFAKSARTKISCFLLSNRTSNKRNNAGYYGTMRALSRQTTLVFTPAWMHFWALFPKNSKAWESACGLDWIRYFVKTCDARQKLLRFNPANPPILSSLGGTGATFSRFSMRRELMWEGNMTRILEKTRSLKWVYDDVGEVIEVILEYDDFKILLQKVARETDWETLPRHLQDVVDAMLMEEASGENSEILPLRDLLRETGEAP